MHTVKDFQELRGITSPTSDNALSFRSKQFKVIRILLRLVALWRPRSAGVLESYVYPVFVNLVLLASGPIRNSIQATEKSVWLNLQLLYVVHEVAIWLCHILGNRYFSSRDMEMNVLRPIIPPTEISKPLSRRLRIVNFAAMISVLFFSLLLCTLYILTLLLGQHGAERFSARLPNVHGPGDHIFYGLVVLEILYDLGVGLALSWTLAILYTSYSARLKILENRFLKWKHSSVDAVSLFQQLYTWPVKKSWKQISWWFLAHNIVALAIPLYGYELAQAVSGRKYHAKHLPQFVCYLLYTVTLWLTPTVLGEFIKRREKKFMDRINDISPWLLDAESGQPNHHEEASPSTSTGSPSTVVSDTNPAYAEYTFASRGEELRNFLRFLKRRTLGLVSRGYSLQLNVSLVSLIGAAISFRILMLQCAETVIVQCSTIYWGFNIVIEYYAHTVKQI